MHGDLAPRLALQTILQAGGYAVDVAASPAEALSKLDAGRYELVLSDTTMSPLNILAYAKVDYRPATAQVTSYEPSAKAAPAGDAMSCLFIPRISRTSWRRSPS